MIEKQWKRISHVDIAMTNNYVVADLACHKEYKL